MRTVLLSTGSWPKRRPMQKDKRELKRYPKHEAPSAHSQSAEEVGDAPVVFNVTESRAAQPQRPDVRPESYEAEVEATMRISDQLMAAELSLQAQASHQAREAQLQEREEQLRAREELVSEMQKEIEQRTEEQSRQLRERESELSQ